MLKTATTLAFFIVALSFGSANAQEELTCEDYRCQFQQMIEERCPCDGQSNHGRYVSCVAHVVKELTDQGLPRNCKGKLKRCAARSVCGKQDRGFHTCTTFDTGVCDTATSLCDDGVTACLSDADCTSSRCKITRHPERCEGSLDLSPSCCASCAQ